jgi:phosphate transport system substrate-binding protein
MPFARSSVLFLQIAVCLGLLTRPLAAQEKVSLVGSGSNMAGSLYSAWTAQYQKLHPDVDVRYVAVGTSQSLREISQGTGDFGGGEIPLKESQKHAGKYRLTQFPTVLVAIAPIYKLPGKPDLRFSGEVLAGIYLGNIKNWNDPRVAKLNPGVAFPDLPITVVHLSGVKGSSYILTDFLSKTSSEWKTKMGKSASPNWPVGLEVNRSDGMATKVSETPGAIGYVELSYVQRKDIGYGSVLNAAAQFVKPTKESILAACLANEKSMPGDLGASLAYAAGKDSYPMASFTWIYVPESGLPAERSKALKEFWNWALVDGREVASQLGYTELPSSIVAKAREAVNSVQ